MEDQVVPVWRPEKVCTIHYLYCRFLNRPILLAVSRTKSSKCIFYTAWRIHKTKNDKTSVLTEKGEMQAKLTGEIKLICSRTDSCVLFHNDQRSTNNKTDSEEF